MTEPINEANQAPTGIEAKTALVRVGDLVEVRAKHSDCCKCTYTALVTRAPYRSVYWPIGYFAVDVQRKGGGMAAVTLKVDLDDLDVVRVYECRVFATFRGKAHGLPVFDGPTTALYPEAAALWVAAYVEQDLEAQHGVNDTAYWEVHVTCVDNATPPCVIYVARTHRIQIDHAVVAKERL